MNIYPPDHKPHVSVMWGGTATNCQCHGCKAVDTMVREATTSIRTVESAATDAIKSIESLIRHLLNRD